MNNDIFSTGTPHIRGFSMYAYLGGVSCGQKFHFPKMSSHGLELIARRIQTKRVTNVALKRTPDTNNSNGRGADTSSVRQMRQGVGIPVQLTETLRIPDIDSRGCNVCSWFVTTTREVHI